jgi:hypothetical protein
MFAFFNLLNVENSVPEQVLYPLRNRRWAHLREKRGAYRALVGKPLGRLSFRIHSRRWKDNIKIYITEIVWNRVGWMKTETSVGLL